MIDELALRRGGYVCQGCQRPENGEVIVHGFADDGRRCINGPGEATMDSNGNMYANKTALDAMDEQLREHFKPTEDMPVDALGIDDPKVAESLSKMNRRARLVYHSERRRGASEQEALGAAEGSYYP